MKKKFLFLSIFLLALLFPSCKKDAVNPVTLTTYDKDAKPVFVANCSPCHMPGGINPNKWDDYTTAKNKIDVILDRINRAQGADGMMPKNGTKLPAETIAILTQWKTDGLLEK